MFKKLTNYWYNFNLFTDSCGLHRHKNQIVCKNEIKHKNGKCSSISLTYEPHGSAHWREKISC